MKNVKGGQIAEPKAKRYISGTFLALTIENAYHDEYFLARFCSACVDFFLKKLGKLQKVQILTIFGQFGPILADLDYFC